MHDRLKVLDLLSLSGPGYTLPQPFYTDPELYHFDIVAIFSRSWLMIGFESELPEPGSYMTITVGQSSVLIVRGRDGVIRGFHNTCRHRGSQICADGHGRSVKLVCPYHKWTYELDGRLIGAPSMSSDFRAADHGLLPVRIELLAGCIYLAFTSEAPEFSPFRAAAAPLFGPVQPGRRQNRVSKLADRKGQLETGHGKCARVLPLRLFPSRAQDLISRYLRYRRRQ